LWMDNMRTLILLLFLLSFQTVPAVPAQVILMRHAEKPLQGPELSLKGLERAAALVPFFLKNPQWLKFGPPAGLIAAAPKTSGSSIRSIQTLQPLACALDLDIVVQFNAEQYLEAAQYIRENPKFEERLVVVAWQHDALPLLARALGSGPEPKQWPRAVFDRLWVLTYRPEGVVEFQDIPQKLLFSDSSNE